MINQVLATSEKWIACSWPARALYSTMYAFSNRDGRLTADRRLLWSVTKAAAVIDLDPFCDVVEEFLKVGLYKPGKSRDGKDFLEIVDFDEGQAGMRYDQEPVGEWITRDAELVKRARSENVSGTGPERDESVSAPLQNRAPLTGKLKLKLKEKLKQKENNNTKADGGDLVSVGGGEPRDWYLFGTRGWRRHREQVGKDDYLPPIYDPDFRTHASSGTFATFADIEALADRFTVCYRRYEKGVRAPDGGFYKNTPRALLNALRRDDDEFPDTPAPRTGPQEAPGQPIMPTMREACPWAFEEHPSVAAAKRLAERGKS